MGERGVVQWAGARAGEGGGASVRIKKLLFSATLKGDARHLGDVQVHNLQRQHPLSINFVTICCAQLKDPLFLSAGGGDGLKMPEALRECAACPLHIPLPPAQCTVTCMRCIALATAALHHRHHLSVTCTTPHARHVTPPCPADTWPCAPRTTSWLSSFTRC